MDNLKYTDTLSKSSMLESFNIDNINENDPSLEGGFNIKFIQDVPIEIRLVESEENDNEMGTLESLKVKLLYTADIFNPELIKIEITSESDLFFHYTSV